MASRAATSIALTLVAAALTGGCGSAAKAPKIAMSWGATVERVGRAWLDGEVPHAYAKRTASTARETLQQQQKSVESRGDVANATAFAERLGALIGGVRHVEVALTARDRDGVARAVAEVHALTRDVAPWAPGGGV